MLIVDSQVHIWASSTHERPWPLRDPIPDYMKGDAIGAEDVLQEMDRLGIKACVLVPPATEGDRNDLVLEACKLYPDRFGAVGRLALDREESRVRLESWLDQRGMLGLRASFIRHAKSWLTDGRCDWVWEVAEEKAIPIMLYAPLQEEAIEKIVRNHPTLPILIDHMNYPMEKLSADDLVSHATRLARLSIYDNVGVKLSGLPFYSENGFPFTELVEPVNIMLTTFGSERLFWGSDYTRLSCTYDQVLEFFLTRVNWSSNIAMENVMGLSLLRWLSWDLR